MAMVKRTFSIPDEVSETLNNTIPNQERSKFISTLLVDALKKRQRKELIDTLDSIEPWSNVQESAAELIRRVRERHSTAATS